MCVKTKDILRLYFRDALGSKQNYNQGIEIYHMLPTPDGSLLASPRVCVHSMSGLFATSVELTLVLTQYFLTLGFIWVLHISPGGLNEW